MIPCLMVHECGIQLNGKCLKLVSVEMRFWNIMFRWIDFIFEIERSIWQNGTYLNWKWTSWLLRWDEIELIQKWHDVMFELNLYVEVNKIEVSKFQIIYINEKFNDEYFCLLFRANGCQNSKRLVDRLAVVIRSWRNSTKQFHLQESFSRHK